MASWSTSNVTLCPNVPPHSYSGDAAVCLPGVPVQNAIATCTSSGCGDIVSGQFECYLWFGSGMSNPFIHFRNQSSGGTRTNCYYVLFDYNNDDCEFWSCIGGSDNQIGEFGGFNHSFRVWRKYRVSWFSHGNDPQLSVRVEIYNSGWQHMIPDWNVANDPWASSGTNYCGFGAIQVSGTTLEVNGPHFDNIDIRELT